MGRKPKNYPTGVTIIQPVLTPEENEAAIKRAQDILILIAIHYLTNKKREKNELKTELNHQDK